MVGASGFHIARGPEPHPEGGLGRLRGTGSDFLRMGHPGITLDPATTAGTEQAESQPSDTVILTSDQEAICPRCGNINNGVLPGQVTCEACNYEFTAER